MVISESAILTIYRFGVLTFNVFVFYSMYSNKRLRRLLNAPAAHLYGACAASKNTRGIPIYISQSLIYVSIVYISFLLPI